MPISTQKIGFSSKREYFSSLKSCINFIIVKEVVDITQVLIAFFPIGRATELIILTIQASVCLLYTSDAADE